MTFDWTGFIAISFCTGFSSLLIKHINKERTYSKKWLVRNSIYIHDDEYIVTQHFRKRKPFYAYNNKDIVIFFAKSIKRIDGEVDCYTYSKEEIVLTKKEFLKIREDDTSLFYYFATLPTKHL